MTAQGTFKPPAPYNEPVRSYAPGTPERASLKARIEQMRRERIEVPCIIGGQDVRTGKTREAVMPHDKDHVLADVHHAGGDEVRQAIDAAAKAWEEWSRWPWRSARPASCAPPSCWPARGGRRFTRARSPASRRPRTRRRPSPPRS